MIQRAKKEVFGYFMDFGLLERLYIANCDTIKGFSHFATLPGYGGSFKHLKNVFLNDPRGQKCDFWPFSGLWSCWIDLILQILILLKVFEHLATSPGHEGSFKNPNNALLNDPKYGKRVFWPFSGV